MAQAIIASVAGLSTDPNPLATGAAGALRVADDVVIASPGTAEARPGFDVIETHPTPRRPATMAAFEAGRIIVSEWDGGSSWAVRYSGSSTPYTTAAGTAEPLDPSTALVQFAQARRNLYWTSKAGPQKLTAYDAQPVAAGMHEACSGLFSVVTAGTPAALPPETARAYRWTHLKRDANGLVLRSPASPWTSYANASTTDTIDLEWQIPLPLYVAAGDQIELYTTITVPHTSTPPDMMYLSTRYTVLAADLTAGYATVRDSRVDDELGQELYTNPTREGWLKTNDRPPACGAMAQWSGCMWYGRTVGPWTSLIEIVSVGGLTSSVTDGLQRFQTSYSGVSSFTLTGIADTSSVRVGQLATDGGIPGGTSGRIPAGTRVVGVGAGSVTLSAAPSGSGAVYFHDGVTVAGRTYWAWTIASGSLGTFRPYATDPERTARELAYAISEYRPGSVYAFAVEDPYAALDARGDATKGTLVIRSRALDAARFTVTTTRDEALSFPAAASGAPAVDRDDRRNGISYSKPEQPESVPELNFLRVGNDAAPIVALMPLRGALMVFKTDGIYRVTGSAPDGWRVDVVDTVQRALRAECVSSLGEVAAAWTQRGVILVDEGGVASITDGRIGRSLQTGAAHVADATTTGAFVACDTVRGWVLVGVPGAPGARNAAEVYCWAQQTRGWSRWTIKPHCVVEDTRDLALYAAWDGAWELREMLVHAPGETPRGYDARYAVPFALSGDGGTAFVDAADAGGWAPAACDWLSADVGSEILYRRIESVSDSPPIVVDDVELVFDGSESVTDGAGGDYELTLAAPFPVSGVGSVRHAYEGIHSVIQWQAVTAGSPAIDALWRELHVQLDWSEYEGTIGGPDAHLSIGATSNRARTPAMVTWTATRDALPTIDARTVLSRDVARSTHLYPRVESCDMGLPWRVLGCAVVHEPTSERTGR